MTACEKLLLAFCDQTGLAGQVGRIREVAERVNPLIETNLGTLLWCGLENCDMFCPVELENVLNLQR